MEISQYSLLLKVKIIMVTQTTGGNSIESGKPLGLIRKCGSSELSALSLDMTQVKG